MARNVAIDQLRGGLIALVIVGHIVLGSVHDNLSSLRNLCVSYAPIYCSHGLFDQYTLAAKTKYERYAKPLLAASIKAFCCRIYLFYRCIGASRMARKSFRWRLACVFISFALLPSMVCSHIGNVGSGLGGYFKDQNATLVCLGRERRILAAVGRVWPPDAVTQAGCAFTI